MTTRVVLLSRNPLCGATILIPSRRCDNGGRSLLSCTSLYFASRFQSMIFSANYSIVVSKL